MTTILIDENLPPKLAQVFVQGGIQAQHVSHLRLKGASDGSIWSQAQILNAVIATKDGDYLDALNLRSDGRLILFKVGNLSSRELLAFVQDRIDRISEFLTSDDRALILHL